MPLRYSSTMLGTVTIVQKMKEWDKPRKFNIQIREGNCMAVFIYVYKNEHPEDPKFPYVHQLVNFLDNEQHLKNIVRSYKGKNVFACMFNADKIEKVRLNLYHKECNTLLKYMVRDGLKVECYWKEDK